MFLNVSPTLSTYCTVTHIRVSDCYFSADGLSENRILVWRNRESGGLWDFESRPQSTGYGNHKKTIGCPMHRINVQSYILMGSYSMYGKYDNNIQYSTKLQKSCIVLWIL
jgi:hypothetical protein